MKLDGTESKPEAVVWVEISNAESNGWTAMGKFSLPIGRDETGEIKASEVAAGIGSGLLGRLVRVQLVKNKKVKGNSIYEIRVDNASSLILNGVSFIGVEAGSSEQPSMAPGLSISPRRSLVLPTSTEFVNKLGLKSGIKVTGVDLSGL